MRLFLIFLFITVIAFANVGLVVMVEGDVIIDRKDVQLNARKGMKLEKADIITTIGKSKIQLEFLDKTVVNLGKDSTFNIEDYFINEQKNNIKANFSIAKGTFKVATGLISKVSPNNFQLKSRTTTIGIRGTEIVGKITDTSDIIACTAGLIAVGSIGVDVEPILVSAGMMTEVSMGQVPQKPKEFSASDLQSIVSDVGEIKIKENGDEQKPESTDETSGEEEKTTEKTEESTEETLAEAATEIIQTAQESEPELAQTIEENLDDIVTQTLQETTEILSQTATTKTRTGGIKGFTSAYIGSQLGTGNFIFGSNETPDDFWIGAGETPDSIEAYVKIKSSCGGIEYTLEASGSEYTYVYDGWYDSYTDSYYDGYTISYFYAVGDNGWIMSNSYDEARNSYDYMSWGEWGSFNQEYESGEYGWWNGWWGHWIAGDMTPEYAIPTTGSATYYGIVKGEVYHANSYLGDFSYLGGNAYLNANFGSKTLTGSLYIDMYGEPWKNASLNGSWSAGNPVITGSLSTSQGDSGNFQAGFFGPNAQELGGSWNLSTNDGNAVGIFAAKQSED